MFERFTERARQVVVLAQDESRTLRHNYIGTEHRPLGVLREKGGLAAHALESFEVTLDEVRAQVALVVGEGDEVGTGQIPFTPKAKTALELALREALTLGHNHVGTEHILLGLAGASGVGARILLDFGADVEKIRNEVVRLTSAPRGASPGPFVGPATLGFWPPPHARRGSLLEYAVKTLEGGSDTWVQQLTAWRQDGWELLAIVTEGEERRAILGRRL